MIFFPKETIYIQWADDDGEILAEITWASEKIYKTDLEFRRTDAFRYDMAKDLFKVQSTDR